MVFFYMIQVGAHGCLLISGLTEQVVQAYSLITDLLERFQGTQDKSAETGRMALGKSLDSSRAFNCLVRRWEDKHTTELLTLPEAVKESLLTLVKESGLYSSPFSADHSPERLDHRAGQGASSSMTGGFARLGGESGANVGAIASKSRTSLGPVGAQDPDGHEMDRHRGTPHLSAAPAVERPSRGLTVPLAVDLPPWDALVPPEPTGVGSKGSRGAGGDGAEQRLVCTPQEVEEEVVRSEAVKEEEKEEEVGDEEVLLSIGSRKEFRLLLKFFTAMGYTEEVVRQVLARTGPREASKILDLVQQEQDRSSKNLEQRDPTGKDTLAQINWRLRRLEVGDGGLGEEGVMGEGVNGRRDKGGLKGEQGSRGAAKTPGSTGSDHLGLLDPTEHSRRGPQTGGAMGMRREPSRDKGDGEQEEDFVLAVLKRAAASCGYTEEKVEEAYSNLPHLSNHQLILQLQREEGVLAAAREEGVPGAPREEGVPGAPREEVDEALLEREARRTGTGEDKRAGLGGHPTAQINPSVMLQPQRPLPMPRVLTIPQPEVRGPPLLTYPLHQRSPPAAANHPPPASQKVKTSDPSPLFPYAHQLHQPQPQPHQLQPPVVKKSQTSDPLPHIPYIYPEPHQPQPYHQPTGHLPPTGQNTKTSNPSPQFSYTYPQPHQSHQHQPPHLPKPKLGPAPEPTQGFLIAALSTGTLVTGEQRFLEGLRKTFDLQLPANPGDPGLRMIIIDGSNVAMSHGLGHFFSCRGIALAVQHFWNRGHRQISTFLPQWRQKRDPKIKEQHYLTKLQDLGLLSYTPSREVLGKRINSYDDRFMLQLAQQSNGVIVTNDNLRDLLDESQAWKDIIKKRLLQYTFVGDLFMVPDDPLGRGGPHLDHFLRFEHRTPAPGSHSFAGLASASPTTKLPRAKTEVLQYRDLAPGGAAPEPGPRGSWPACRKERGPGRASSPGQGTGGRAAGPGGLEAGPDRGVDETARLRESLCQVFPGQDSTVGLVLQRHPAETDINFLSHAVLEQQGG
ncbi:NEDD4-binding protein 1 [Merluccius polli]|uniref:NEDD4-binding protein 1 n=1 Tax=Merluccius polli TaxID=89951 RepID=A0AA47MFZ0_MERPO|nr:NEDD4-binding protein 1 [Merluccius polli]